MKYCQKCGAQSPDEYNFCLQCGEKLAETQPQPQPGPTSPLQPHPTQPFPYNPQMPVKSASSLSFMHFLPYILAVAALIISYNLSMTFGFVFSLVAGYFSIANTRREKGAVNIGAIVVAGISLLITLSWLFKYT